MKETYKSLVKLYKYKGNEYAIVQGIHDGIIRAINYNCLDENGRTTQPLNGIEMFCSKEANTVEEIIKRINLKIDFDEYIKQNDIDTSDMKTLAKAYKKFYEKNEKKSAVQEEGRTI